MDSDIESYHWLLDCGLQVQVILTKADKLSKNAAMAQKALFKRELGLDDSRIMTYSVTQNTMRSELIGRINDGTGRALLSGGKVLIESFGLLF